MMGGLVDGLRRADRSRRHCLCPHGTAPPQRGASIRLRCHVVTPRFIHASFYTRVPHYRGTGAQALTRTEWGEGEDKERFKFTNFLVLLQARRVALLCAACFPRRDRWKNSVVVALSRPESRAGGAVSTLAARPSGSF